MHGRKSNQNKEIQFMEKKTLQVEWTWSTKKTFIAINVLQSTLSSVGNVMSFKKLNIVILEYELWILWAHCASLIVISISWIIQDLFYREADYIFMLMFIREIFSLIMSQLFVWLVLSSFHISSTCSFTYLSLICPLSLQSISQFP